jgi:predicted pyridoxine 5'-phosphate oxidase superfamily flavin-nucleotide-binding protein
MADSPFHDGELDVQTRAGEREMAATVGEMIGDAIPIGGRAFLANQRLLAVSGTDATGRLWASVWSGAPGFATSSPDGRGVTIVRDATDPIVPRVGEPLGLLAIELATRRRLRINGMITRLDDATLELEVAEAFPNCPKYITRRELRTATPRGAIVDGDGALDADRIATIARADTAFVASRHPTRGADASHRGGPVGFIQVVDATTLRIPDYAGNSMFQTLGNFTIDPAAGLAILDFERGRLLQLSGRARVVFEPERAWDFTIERWRESPLAVAGTVVVR